MEKKYFGYCNKCGSKVLEILVLGYFDDFTVRCWKCGNTTPVYEMKFKSSEDNEVIDNKKKLLYNNGRKL